MPFLLAPDKWLVNTNGMRSGPYSTRPASLSQHGQLVLQLCLADYFALVFGTMVGVGWLVLLRILLAEDHKLVRRGTRGLLQAQRCWTVV